MFNKILIFVILFKNVHSIIPGGINVDLTRNGLDYFGKLAETGVPQLLGNLKLPDQVGTGWSVSNMELMDVQKPKIRTQFLDGIGLDTDTLVPTLKLRSDFSAGFGWFSTEGNLTAELKLLDVKVTVGLGLGGQGLPIFSILRCNASVNSTTIEFGGSMGSTINMISGFIEDYISSSINEMLCDTARIAAESYTNSTYIPFDPNVPSPLCEGEETETKLGEGIRFPIQAFTLNMSMSDSPYVTGRTARMNFNGTILFNGKLSQLTNINKLSENFQEGPKMLRIVVADMVPNSFFWHVWANNLAKLDKKVSIQKLPGIVRKPIHLMCRGCNAKLRGGLNAPPVLYIRPSEGVYMKMNGWVQSYVAGFFRKMDLFWVNTNILANVYPFVLDERLVADTKLDRIDVHMNRASGMVGQIMGMFLEELGDALTRFVPMHIGPDVQTFIQNVMGKEGGIPLPAMCGLKIMDPTLYYVDNAIVIDANLEYDPSKLFKLMRDMMSEMSVMKKK